VPLVVSNAQLWLAIARVKLWKKQYKEALEMHAKAFRTWLNRPNLATDESVWNNAVSAAEGLVAAYESFGELEEGGTPISADWRFKARSAVRSLRGLGKRSWEDSAGWERLGKLLQELEE